MQHINYFPLHDFSLFSPNDEIKFVGLEELAWDKIMEDLFDSIRKDIITRFTKPRENIIIDNFVILPPKNIQIHLSIKSRIEEKISCGIRYEKDNLNFQSVFIINIQVTPNLLKEPLFKEKIMTLTNFIWTRDSVKSMLKLHLSLEDLNNEDFMSTIPNFEKIRHKKIYISISDEDQSGSNVIYLDKLLYFIRSKFPGPNIFHWEFKSNKLVPPNREYLEIHFETMKKLIKRGSFILIDSNADEEQKFSTNVICYISDNEKGDMQSRFNVPIPNSDLIKHHIDNFRDEYVEHFKAFRDKYESRRY